MSSPGRQFKDQLYGQFARIGKAVASPRRLELLDLLCQGERTVEALAREANLSLANTSQHLQVLRAAHLVDARKDGLFVTYRLADETVAAFFQALRRLAEQRLADVDRVVEEFFEAREGMEPIDRDALIARVRQHQVTILDVRPVEEYRAGHIPGAISIPLEELEHRLALLPRDQEVVAYCRGPYCVLAVEAVERLRRAGLRARRLADGVLEWRVAGLPVAVGMDAGSPPARACCLPAEAALHPGRPGPSTHQTEELPDGDEYSPDLQRCSLRR